jgi:predicted ABC-type ATPase
MPAPTIYVIAGCNGAGKTTFAKEFLPSIGVIRFLNADEIARGLSPLRPEASRNQGERALPACWFRHLAETNLNPYHRVLSS